VPRPGDRSDLGWVRYDAFRQKETSRQLFVITGRPHRDRQVAAVDQDFERLFDHDLIRLALRSEPRDRDAGERAHRRSFFQRRSTSTPDCGVGEPKRWLRRGSGDSELSPRTCIRTAVSLYAGVWVGMSVWLPVRTLTGLVDRS